LVVSCPFISLVLALSESQNAMWLSLIASEEDDHPGDPQG
jgi:hypothetical protein